MTEPNELIHQARSLGARLWVEGTHLEVDLPGDFPEEVLQRLRKHKVSILAALTEKKGKSEQRETANLLAWANDLSERQAVLSEPVVFVEAPLRTITTVEVSRRASIYLRTITMARSHIQGGGWHPFSAEWWQEQEAQALQALWELRRALEVRELEDSPHG